MALPFSITANNGGTYAVVTPRSPQSQKPISPSGVLGKISNSIGTETTISPCADLLQGASANELNGTATPVADEIPIAPSYPDGFTQEGSITTLTGFSNTIPGLPPPGISQNSLTNNIEGVGDQP